MSVEDEELEERTCCGVIEESAARAREDRYKERDEPQPWLVQKFMVALTLGIIGYTGYVYLAVFVTPMIQEREGAVADRRTGIALLVPFCVLYVWVVWAYIKVCVSFICWKWIVTPCSGYCNTARDGKGPCGEV